MKIALSIWQDRIAPVFDVGTVLLLVELDGNEVVRQEEVRVPEDPAGKIHGLVTAGVSELICGAVSRPVRMMLEAGGICVNDFLAGNVDALLTLRLTTGEIPDRFRMPGCGGRRQRRGGREKDYFNTEEVIMPRGDGKGPMGKGPQSGWGNGPCSGQDAAETDLGTESGVNRPNGRGSAKNQGGNGPGCRGQGGSGQGGGGQGRGRGGGIGPCSGQGAAETELGT